MIVKEQVEGTEKAKFEAYLYPEQIGSEALVPQHYQQQEAVTED